jgi:hypothetical protein
VGINCFFVPFSFSFLASYYTDKIKVKPFKYPNIITNFTAGYLTFFIITIVSHTFKKSITDLVVITYVIYSFPSRKAPIPRDKLYSRTINQIF